MEVPQGSTVFNVDQPCHGFPLLLDGTVRVTKIAPNGREIVLYRVEPGQGCILSGGCLLGDSTYCASAIAEENVTVARVPPALFQKLILEFPPFRAFVFGMYGRRLAEVMELVAALIDPVMPTWQRDLKLANQLGLKLVYTVDTHIHAEQAAKGASTTFSRSWAS